MIQNTNHPVAERLEAFAEGLLDAGDRVVIESHLLGCEACERAVEEWRALFATLSALPLLEPRTGFADRVMARVRVSPARTAWSWQAAQAALQLHAAQAGSALSRLMPKTSFGWAVATTLRALPFVLGTALLAWLMSRSYITPASLWAFVSTQAVDGARGLGATAVSTAMQTELAAWIYANAAAFLEKAGVTGVGIVVGVASVAIMLSIWVLYRNLFRTPTRESQYASYSI
jgi:anti-sigma factor RsiW